MRILITGANGFIAREIIAKLAGANHEITACVHHQLLENTPHDHKIQVDFAKATQPEAWLGHLKNIDIVINCVGVFQTLKEETMWKIHYETPKALFDACMQLKIKKIIHISALGIDKSDVPYAKSKLAIEQYLKESCLDSAIIRPSLVYGKGSYGGTSLFRGLAGLPFILPLPGKANQLQQPIHIDDLIEIVEKSMMLSGKQFIYAVGDEKLTIKNLLIKLRSWLGFKKAFTISIPTFFLQAGAKIGNLMPNSPISDTGIKMMMVDNIATAAEEKNLETVVGFKPRGFTSGLKGMVSHVQDRWHARLYFLRPIIRLCVGLVWLLSGIISILPIAQTESYHLLAQTSIPTAYHHLVLYAFSFIDILLGLATIFNYRLMLIGFLQCFLIVSYTVYITIYLPLFWIHPFLPIIKNLTLLAATFVMLALASER